MIKSPPRKWWVWLLLVLAGFFLLSLVLVGWQQIRIARAQERVEAAREALRAAGAPMTFKELAVGPPLADEDNAALVLAEIEAKLDGTPLDEAIDAVQEWGYNDYEHPGWDASWDKLSRDGRQQLTDLLAREDTQEVLKLARKTADMPGLASRIEFTGSSADFLQNVGYLQRLTRLLVVEANRCAWLAAQASDEASRDRLVFDGYDNLLIGLKLSRLVSDDQTFVNAIIVLTGIAMEGIVLEHLQQINQTLPLPSTLCEAFQRELWLRDMSGQWRRMMDGERVFTSYWVEKYDMLSAQSIGGLDFAVNVEVFGPDTDDYNTILFRAAYYIGLPDIISGFALYLDYSKTDRKIDFLDEEAWSAYDKRVAELDLPKVQIALLELLQTSRLIHPRLLQSYALRQIVATGLAVNAYADDHGGQLPKSLDVLVPDYLPAVPVDPFAEEGAGFHYVPEGSQFRLWAVGMNREDDGGLYDAEDWNQEESDVVFRGRRAVFNDS